MTIKKNGKELAAYASWMDVTAGLEIAAGVAEKEGLPECGRRTRQIATDLGFRTNDDYKDHKRILILSEVTEQTVLELRALADEWEATLNGQRHWHVSVESQDCDGRYSRTYVTKVRPDRMEFHEPTEEGFHAEEATECVRVACQDQKSTQRDHSAEAAGY